MHDLPAKPSEPGRGGPVMPMLRLHPVAAAVNGLRALRRLVPLLVLILISPQQELRTVAMVAVFGGLSTLLGIGRWARFRYGVAGDELRVERGLLLRKRVFVPIDQVQAVNITAGVLQRMFGLVRVEVKTAAAGNQVELSAVSSAEARRLQRLLARSVDATNVAQPPASSGVVRMTRGQLLFAAATSGQLGVVLGGLVWIHAQTDQVLEKRLIEYLESDPQLVVDEGSVTVFVAIIVAGVVLALALSVVGALIRYGGFSVERRGDELVIVRGLLERRETVISVPRIQAIRIVESLPRQPFGFATIFVESAGHAEEKGQSSYLHPCLHRSQWRAFLLQMAPDFVHDTATWQRPPTRARIRFLFVPLVVTTIAAAAIASSVSFGFVAFALPAIAAVFGWLRYRDTGLGFSQRGDVLVLRSRLAERVTAVVPRRRVQFADTTASPFQRRRRVATCTVAAASGASGRSFSAVDMDEGLALAVLDWTTGAPPPGVVVQP